MCKRGITVDVVSICLYDELFLGFFFGGGGRGMCLKETRLGAYI